MEDHNSNKSENDDQINLSEIKSAVQELLLDKFKKSKRSHKDILNEVLTKFEPLDFLALAEMANKNKLLPKHEMVLCVEQILKTFRDDEFDLAKKNDSIFVYNGEYWKAIDGDSLKNFLSKAAEKLGVDYLDARHYEFTDKIYKQILKDAFFEPFEKDNQKVSINLANGTFDIDSRAQKLREFRASDFLTYQLPFEFDETADCPMFQSFLDVVLPEEELQHIVSEFLAYPFTKHLKLEKAAFFYGKGGNGKSVLFDVIRALYGQENITNFSLSNLMEEHNRALIANKLLNYGSEINATTTRDIFKILVSTEPIQARLKYGNSFMMEHYAKLCFNSNELPRDIEQSHAYFRRLLIVPFRVKISDNEDDKEFAQKIVKNELPGVFNWILKGLRRLLENKNFTVSNIVAAEIQTYRNDSDSVALFLEESNLARHSTKTLLLKNIYSAYRDFCYENGYKPLNNKNFSKRLQDVHDYAIVRRNSGMNIYCAYLRNNPGGDSEM